MKNILIIASFAAVLFGCNLNPSKGERIENLELGLQQSTDRINKLESQVQSLSDKNEQLRKRILQLEKSE